MLDVVDGIIIGPCTVSATLHTPNGRQYGNPRTFDVTEGHKAIEWAKEYRSEIMAQVGPAECARLGWDQPWEVRIHD